MLFIDLDRIAYSYESSHELRPQPMHPALQVGDILREIFGHLATKALTPSDRRTFTALALVNKDFSDLALDILWQRLDSFDPLLKVFGRTLISEKACDEMCQCTLPEVISDEEWKRFLGYARRVRTLRLVDLPKNMNHLALLVLVHRAGNSPIFTSLLSLELSFEMPPTTMMLCFLTHTLRHITSTTKFLSNKGPTGPAAACILPLDVLQNHIKPRAQWNCLLRELVVSGPLKVRHVTIFARFGGLRKLHVCGVIPAKSMALLAAIPGLQDLRLQVQATTDCSSLWVFRTMQRLHVEGPVFDLVWFLKHISAPLLHSVTIKAINRPLDPDAWVSCRPVLDTLCATVGHSLRTLSLELMNIMMTVYSQAPPLMGALSPLLALCDVEHFSIKAGLTLSLQSADIQAMAQAWPHIKSLKLEFLHVSNADVPCVSALAHFARHCPRLRTVHLSGVRCDPKVPLLDISNVRVESRELRSLTFRYFPALKFPQEYENVIFMKLWVSHLFPLARVADFVQVPSGEESQYADLGCAAVAQRTPMD